MNMSDDKLDLTLLAMKILLSCLGLSLPFACGILIKKSISVGAEAVVFSVVLSIACCSAAAWIGRDLWKK